MVIDKIAGRMGQIPTDGKNLHIVEFDEQDMEKTHQRFQTLDGWEAAISLEGDQKLEDGLLLFAGEQDYILVRAAREKVFVLKPKGEKAWGKTCYNIGNMHKKAYFYQDLILVPYDAILEGIWKKLDLEYSVEERRIVGEKANISAGEHAHVHAGEKHQHG